MDQAKKVSVSPDGTEYPLPGSGDYEKEFLRLQRLSEEQKALGRQIVVVQGLGFVGSPMASVVADATDEKGQPMFFVIGLQRPSRRSYWKVPMLNAGKTPIKAEDPEVAEIVTRTVLEKKTMTSTFDDRALSLAEIIVVDVQCDATKPEFGNAAAGYVEMEAFKAAMVTVGQHIKPEALVLIETTVAPGTCKHIVLPILQEEFKKRGITSTPRLAHSYERVMPGREYISSIRDFWRVYAGIDEISRDMAGDFLGKIITKPLAVMGNTTASELSKTCENNWRATVIAIMFEWALLAEKVGVNLWEVADAIKVRPTHRNIMGPGLGVGGYCLPKDTIFAYWAAKNIFSIEGDVIPISLQVININDTRALHAVELAEEALAVQNKQIKGKKVAVLGASYRQDVGDTRYSPSELVIRKLQEIDAEPVYHDPYVTYWPEFAEQDEDPHSWAHFFKNQEPLKQLNGSSELSVALNGADVIILATPHAQYKGLVPEEMVAQTGKKPVVIDTFNIIDDEQIKGFLRLGCEVRGFGKGHILALKVSL